jgi:hypothetical protein
MYPPDSLRPHELTKVYDLSMMPPNAVEGFVSGIQVIACLYAICGSI